MDLKTYQRTMIERMIEQQKLIPDPVPEDEATADDYVAALIELGVDVYAEE